MVGAPTYPRRFGKYVLAAPLARGGMGELHLAISERAELKKLYVIKQILQYLTDKDFVERFSNEVKLASQLSHGNLVPVFEGGEVDGQYYLVMEYIEGKDLRALWKRLMDRQRRLPVDVALHIAKEVCRALDYVHTFGQLGLVHRDISPPNVLLSYSGEVRITDFGLACSRFRVQKTAPGILFGKLSYMPPEQALKGQLDARTDLYSTGVILWELLTGRRLFPREGPQRERLKRAVNPEVSPPSKCNPDLPPELDAIVLRALAPRSEDRYPSAEAMRRDLASVLARVGPTTDASSVKSLLLDLFGDQLERDRRERTEHVEGAVSLARSTRGRRPKQTSGLVQVSSDAAEIAQIQIPRSEAPVAPTPRLKPGTTLGKRYRVDGQIGEGGMGIVYSATHIGIDKKVAIKVLHSLYSWVPDVVQRFRTEAKAASRIGHPHIIEVYDSGTTDDGSVYFAMEYLDGQDLADVLDDEGTLSIERTIHIGIHIAEALAAAHSEGIVHRDLKPENIFLIARDGDVDFVKVLDFGIAQGLAADGSLIDRVTRPGTAMGTPEYMAPEQAAGRRCDHRADVYALGSLLYEMLVGETPHPGANMLEVLNRKVTELVPAIDKRRPEVPPELAHIVHWALEHAPEDRPQTMNHLAYELTKLTAGRAGAVASMLGLGPSTAMARRSTSPGSYPVLPALAIQSGTGSYQRLATGPLRPIAPLEAAPSNLEATAPSPALALQAEPAVPAARHGPLLRNLLVGAMLLTAGAAMGILLLTWVAGRETPSRAKPQAIESVQQPHKAARLQPVDEPNPPR